MTNAPDASKDAASDPMFLALHATRIKGTCDAATAADVTGLTEEKAKELLDAAAENNFVRFREGRRGGYRLTDDGRAKYTDLLKEDTAPDSVRSSLETAYEGFLLLNGKLKEVCGKWQIRDGQPNDHSDTAYDDTVIAALASLNDDIRRILDSAAESCERLGTYARRLDAALARVQAGDNTAFARPLARSYHDAWMELHQDFLLSLGRERSEADGH